MERLTSEKLSDAAQPPVQRRPSAGALRLPAFIALALDLLLLACGAAAPLDSAVQRAVGQLAPALPAVLLALAPIDQLLLGMIYGTLLSMLGYNLLLAITRRAASYGYYTLSLGCLMLAYAIDIGPDMRGLWLGPEAWNAAFVHALIGGGLFGSLKFIDTFLSARAQMPRIHRAITLLLIGVGAFSALPAVVGAPTLNLAEWGASSLVGALILLAIWRARRAGNGLTRYLLLAWPIMALTMTTHMMTRAQPHALNMLPPLGLMAVGLCWSLALQDQRRALADGLQQAQNERLREQQEALRSNQAITTTLRHTNQDLRRLISEREQMEAAEQRRRLLLEEVVRLGKAVGQVTELRACLLKVYHSVQAELGFDRVGIFIYEPEHKTLHGSFGSDRTGALTESWEFIHPLNLYYDILSTPGGFRYTADYTVAFALPPDDPMAGVREHIAVAAWAGEEPIGLIAADNLLTQRTMTEAQIEALRLFAGYAGMAIANARLLAQVRDAEQRYRSIFEHAIEGIFQSAPDGRILSANPALARICGYATPGEFTAHVTSLRGQMFANPDRYAALLRALEAEGAVRGFEFQGRHRDGSRFWLSLNARAVRSASGALHYFEGSIEDISERKQAEQALRRYAARMEILHEIDRAILAAQSPAEIAVAALNHLRRLLDCRRANVAVFEPPDQQARILATIINGSSASTSGDRVPLAAFGDLDVLMCGSPRYIDDLAGPGAPPQIRTRLLSPSVRSALIMPLIVNSQLIGALTLGIGAPGTFTDEHLDITREVADQLAISIHQASLQSQTSEALDREQRLNEVSRTISQTLDLSALIPNVVRLTAGLVRAESGALAIISPDQQSISAPYLFNYPDEQSLQPAAREEGGLVWQIASSRETVRVDDYAKHPAALPDHAWIKAFLGAPVTVGGTTIGVLYFFNRDPDRRFSERDQALVEAIGSQAGVAIQNARLFAAEQQRVALLTTIYDIGLALSAQLDQAGLLQTLLQQAAQLFDCHSGGLYLIQPESQALERVASLPSTGARIQLRAGEGMVGQIAASGEPLVVADYRAWPGRLDIFSDPTFRAAVGVPILWQGRVTGVLVIASGQVNRFSPADVEALRLLAAQAAVAIQNAQLFSATRRQLQELMTLHALAVAWTEAGSEDSLIARATAIICDALFQDYCGVLLVDHASGALRVHPSHRGISEQAKRSIIPLGQGIVGTVAATGQPCRIPDVRREPRYMAANTAMRSELCVPLKAGQQIIGVINVESPKENAFSEADERLLVTCAGQLATAIERRRAGQERDQLYYAAQDAIRRKDEALALLDTLLQSAPIGMAFFDTRLRFVRINDALALVNGASAQAHIGRTLREMLPNLAPTLEPLLTRILASGEPIDGHELVGETPSAPGRERIWLASFYPVRDRGGQVLGLGAAVIEITERRRLEAQFLQAQKMESIGQLAGGIAHDFNNMLTAITGYTELAQDMLPSDEPIRQDLDEILKAAGRATNLTRQLLAFARKQIIEPQVLNLNDLILDVDKLLRRLIGEDIELVTLTAPDLGLIKVDPGQIEQVLINLAVNARHAMPNGGKLMIATRNAELDDGEAQRLIGLAPGPYVLMEISDTGVGMDLDVQSHIFEPFFTTKGPGEGTGLGLATCYGIIKQHGGNISARSELGHGSTFEILLPRAELVAGDPEPPPDPPGLPLGSEIVLLAEDEPSVRAMAARILRQQGYCVLEAPNGEEALRLAREPHVGPIALLLTDMVMPHLGGKALAEHVTRLHPGIKVLFMSGYTDAMILAQSQGGATTFLQKPFSPGGLARKVREVLDS